MTMHHYWRLRDGKVAYFRGSEDTELTAQVFTADPVRRPRPAQAFHHAGTRTTLKPSGS